MDFSSLALVAAEESTAVGVAASSANLQRTVVG